MASVIHWYRDLMDNRSDPRVKDWLLMASPLPTIAACVCYAYCAKVLGPKLMEHRKPFRLREVLIVYNLIQTLFSSWIFYEELPSFLCLLSIFATLVVLSLIAQTWINTKVLITHWFSRSFSVVPLKLGIVFRCLAILNWTENTAEAAMRPSYIQYLMSGWLFHYNFSCQLVDYSRNPVAMRMANTCWWYYFSKFTEFFDTLFFVLRKKNEHVSTLHVIHHGIMPFSVWMGLKFAPGGHSTFFALLNTFVHIVMYFYYMVAAMGPKYQKYIWWKKYLTAFQMVQFVLIFSHQLQVLFRPSCTYPRVFVYWIAMHGFLFLFLFSDFYKAKYTSDEKKRRAQKSDKGLCMAVGVDESKLSNGKNGYSHDGDTNVPNSYASSDADAFVRQRLTAS